MKIISKSWAGKERLWKTFWILFVVLNTVLGVAAVPLALSISTSLFYPTIVLCAIFWLFTAIAVFKCANNSHNKVWGILARLAVAISLISGVYGFTL